MELILLISRQLNNMAQPNISTPLVKEEKYKSLSLLIKLALNCGISGFCFGYFVTSFNAISFRDIVSIFSLEDYSPALTQGILTGSICFTAALGTTIGRNLISKYPRRHSLMILSWSLILLCLFTLIPHGIILFISRLGQGMAIGCISCLTPLYIKQMMPKEVSGPLWSAHQVLYVTGLSFSFVLVYILAYFMKPAQSWRIVFGFPIVLCIIQLINFTYFYRLDTPRWYILHGDSAGAKQAIAFIYKPEFVSQILKQTIDAHEYLLKKYPTKIQENKPYTAEVEMDMLKADGKIKEKPKPLRFINNTINKPTYNRLAVFAGLFIIGQQQLLGGVAVVQYAGQMTLRTFPNLQTTFPAVVNSVGILGAIVSIQILRRWGRKQLLTYGAYVAMASLLVITLIFWKYDFTNVEQNSFILRVILLIGFLVVRFILSSIMGPVPWLYIAETLQPSFVPMCFLLNWLVLGLVSLAFPLICAANGENPRFAFLFFFIVASVACFVNPKVVIQTKGKSQLSIKKQYDELWK